MSKNKKKKLKKKEKQKQKMLELTQQQIQVNFFFLLFISIFSLFFFLSEFKDAEKQKQNLINSSNQINLNKLSITDEIDLSSNGHKQNSVDESDEDNPEHEQSLNEQAALAAAAAISGDTNKPTDLNESDPINRRMLFFVFKFLNNEYFNH